MPVWTAEPGSLTVTYTVYQEGMSKTIEATVKDAFGAPVNKASVCFYQNMYFLTDTTNENGKIRFKGITTTFNDGKLTATKHNYRPGLLNNVTVGGG